jgi:hypothetical protein
MQQTQAGGIQLYRRDPDKLPPDTLTKISSGTEWQDKLVSLQGSRLGAHVTTFFVGNVVYMAFKAT